MSDILKAKNILVLDLETQKSFKEANSKLEKLKVSVVGTYDYRTDEYVCYEEAEIMELEKRLREVDILIGFNHRRFDMPVLQPYLFSEAANIPLLDLLDEIESQRGHRASLDSLAKPTLGAQKSGSGLEALTLFKEGRMDALKKYCLDDVRLTREVFEYGVAKGKVKFTSTWDYKTYDIKVTWKAQTEELLKKAASAPPQFPSSLF